jgi:hypothetical protein
VGLSAPCLSLGPAPYPSTGAASAHAVARTDGSLWRSRQPCRASMSTGLLGPQDPGRRSPHRLELVAGHFTSIPSDNRLICAATPSRRCMRETARACREPCEHSPLPDKDQLSARRSSSWSTRITRANVVDRSPVRVSPHSGRQRRAVKLLSASARCKPSDVRAFPSSGATSVRSGMPTYRKRSWSQRVCCVELWAAAGSPGRARAPGVRSKQ